MRVRVLTPLNFGGRRYGSGETIDIPHDCPLQQLAENRALGQQRLGPPHATRGGGCGDRAHGYRLG
jgi:hypothetical protein